MTSRISLLPKLLLFLTILKRLSKAFQHRARAGTQMRQGSQYRLKCITQGSLFVQLLLACAAQPSCSAGGTATRRLPRPFRCVPHWAGSPAIAASPGSHQAGSLRWHTARASGSRALHSRKRHTGGGGAASGSASGAAGKHAARQAGARAAIARAGSQLDRTIVKQETASLSFSGQHCMRACGPPTRTVLLIQPDRKSVV